MKERIYEVEILIDENRLIEDIKDDAKRIISRVFGEVPSEFIDDYLKQMEWLINDQPKISEWIPCNEETPKMNGEYLVTDYNKCWVCEFISFGWLGGWANDAKNPVVKAWMPLPELHKRS